MSVTPIKYEKRIQDIYFRDRRKDKTGSIACAPHLHRELELVYFIEGEVIAIADSERRPLRGGDVFLSFPNQVHSYIKTTGVERYVIFILKADMIPEFAELFASGIPESPVIEGAGNDPQIKMLFELLIDTCIKNDESEEGDAYAAAQRRGYLLALFSALLPRMKISKLSLGDSNTLRSIVAFCAQNYAENLSLSLLQERLHLNKYYISHLFNDKLKIRFNDYVNALRINEACRFLANTESSITEIGEQVGFNTLRTFNRAFMKHVGSSPSDYRKRYSTIKAGGEAPFLSVSVGEKEGTPFQLYKIQNK